MCSLRSCLLNHQRKPGPAAIRWMLLDNPNVLQSNTRWNQLFSLNNDDHIMNHQSPNHTQIQLVSIWAERNLGQPFSQTNKLACLLTYTGIERWSLASSDPCEWAGDPYINSAALPLSPQVTNKKELQNQKERVEINKSGGCKMNSKISDIPAEKIGAKSFKSRSKPLPKRGQIKSRIAANALHSIVSALSKASSDRKSSSRKCISSSQS